MNKHLTETHRKLVDQTPDTKITICDRLFFCIENLSNLKRHLCLLIGFCNIRQIIHLIAVADPHAHHCLGMHIVHNHIGQFL